MHYKSEHIENDSLKLRIKELEKELISEKGKNKSINSEYNITDQTLRIAVETMIDPFGIFGLEKDKDGNVIDLVYNYVNDAACKNYRMKREDIIGKTMTNLFPNTKDSKILKDYFRVAETGEPLITELSYTDKFGDQYLTIAFDIRASKIEDGIVISWIDITERKHAEIILKENEERQQFLLSSSPSLIYTVKPDNKNFIVTFISPVMKNLFGYDPEEFVNSSFWLNLIHPDDRLKIQIEMSFIFELRYNKLEYRFRHKEGYYRWVLDESKLIYNEDGSIKEIIGYLLDITERKKAEEELERYAKELQVSNASKDKFFSIISHDLRSPFNGLLGLTNLLIEDYDDLSREEIKEFVLMISKTSDTLFNLIENLLHWSRIQTGKLKVNPETFYINKLIDELSPIFNPVAAKKNISLEFIADKEILVHADKNMISSVIQNLISNAIKFTNINGKIILTVFKNINKVQISVEDNGVGIQPEEIDKLFKIEEHTSKNGTAEEKGSGLGLILCKEFVEKNGGKIWIESTPDKGSRFSFSIPLI